MVSESNPGPGSVLRDPEHFEPPTQQQRELAAAARLAGKMKPGQQADYWRKLLLLDGVEADRIEDVLQLADQQHQNQVRRRQAPLRPLAMAMIGCGGLGVCVLPILLLYSQTLSTWIWGFCFLLAGGVLIYRGMMLRRSLAEESDLNLDLRQPSLFRDKRIKDEDLD